ncbi:MAG: efflux RND transporter periplasmic adaptor subunit [Armatimonadota bacterium]
MNVRTILVPVLGALLLGAAVYPVLSRREDPVRPVDAQSAEAPIVRTAPVTRRAMSREILLTGQLKSGSEASLSPKLGGRVLAVLVAEGQAVRAGDVLLRIDTSDAQGQVDQAAAGVAAARAALQKAREGLRLKEIDVERRVREAERGVEQAKLAQERAEAGMTLQRKALGADVQRASAGVDAARSALARAKKGATPEQRRQAEIQLRQAERGLEQAKKSLDDVQFLADRGGLPRIQLDQAREGYKKAEDGVELARAQLQALERGASAEEIAAAEAQLRSAESGLQAARAAAGRGEIDDAELAVVRSQVRQAEDGLKTAIAARAELRVAREDVRAAEAALLQAQAGHRLARQQLDSGALLSPIDGTVTAVRVNAGEMAGPGMPAVTVVSRTGAYLEAGAPARHLSALRPGLPVQVSLDASRDRTFPGTVRTVDTVAGPDGRTFPVKIDVTAPAAELKPGARARATVRAAADAPGLAVPLDALRYEGERTSVWTVRDGHLAEVPVSVAMQEGGYALVDPRGAELEPGVPVVLSGAVGVAPGDPVRVRGEAAR